MKPQSPFYPVFAMLVTAALLLAACQSGASPTPTPAAPADLVSAAQGFVDLLAKGDFASAEAQFDAAMKNALPEEKLKSTWAQVTGQAGAYQKQLGTRTDTQQGYRIVFVTCQFEKAAIDVRVVYGAAGQISGLFFSPAQAGAAGTPTPAAGLASDALAMVQQMARGDFAAVMARFDDKMKAALTEDAFRQLWQQTLSQHGAFKAAGEVQAVPSQGYTQVYVTCQFEQSALDVVLVFNPAGQVAGLQFAAPGSAASAAPQAYTPPAYVRSGSFSEIEVTVGSGEWALPGTLSLPSGGGPFPVVVLVHGSGPNDRDESIGPNKVFRDLAWGLASQGIAVLRYDKRTKAHATQITPELLARFTVNEETVDDAVLAAQLLQKTPTLDPKRVFVLGHSLGATVAPRIAQRLPSLAGIVLLAGLARPLEDAIVDQYTYLYGLSGPLTAAQQAELDRIKAQAARVKDPALSPQTPTADLPLDTPAAYWLDLRDYHPTEVAKTLSLPMLVLQGGRDYQVSPTLDFPLWQAALAGKPNAALKLYPALNHLFIAGTGQPNPAEYNQPGHVSEEVVNDIAAWIKGR